MQENAQTTMMYYWIVKHDGSEDQDIISYREEFGTLRQHHIIVESLSPPLKSASFALGRQINTDKTWRDLNDALVTYLQSQSGQDDKEQPTLGVNVGADNRVPVTEYSLIRAFLPGTIVAFRSPTVHNSKASFSKSRGGIF